MFKVVIAADKFRGSLSANEAVEAMRLGVLHAHPEALVDCVPMADGGEGTVNALVLATAGRFCEAQVSDPLARTILAQFGRLGDGKTAVIEMAAASGLALLSPLERDPGRTSTVGTGELLVKALDGGASHVVIGLGGSATNDGGAGFAQAIGYRLLDNKDKEIGPGGRELERLCRIDSERCDPRIHDLEILVATDVTNPLCGPTGASRIFGPQKGADNQLVGQLDRNLAHFARIIERDLGRAVLDLPGAGAAGGLGAGLLAFTNARIKPGVEVVMNAANLADRLQLANLCLTGEGAIDKTTALGKTVAGVASLSRSLGCPVIAIGGTVVNPARCVIDLELDAVFSLCSGPISLEEALREAKGLLKSATEQAIRAFLAGCKAGNSSINRSHE